MPATRQASLTSQPNPHAHWGQNQPPCAKPKHHRNDHTEEASSSGRPTVTSRAEYGRSSVVQKEKQCWAQGLCSSEGYILRAVVFLDPRVGKYQDGTRDCLDSRLGGTKTRRRYGLSRSQRGRRDIYRTSRRVPRFKKQVRLLKKAM